MNQRISILGWLVVLSLGLGVSPSLYGQTGSKEAAKKERELSKEISKREKELSTLRSEIQAYEKRYKESEKKEKSTLENISNLERQSGLIRNLIKKLREQEQQLTGDIQEARTSIQELEQQLDALKNHYAKYVRSVYKYGRVYDVELLFSSKSVNQLYIRIEYLKRFSDQRAKDLQDVVHKKSDLEVENERLEANLEHERNLLVEKTSAESSLQKKVTQRQRVLAAIRQDKKEYQKVLNEKKKYEEEIKRIIAKLNEEDRKRKELAAAAARDRTAPSLKPPPTPETAVGAFASQQGRLRWPVSSGTIASRFGNQVHPVLKTVRENTGIDIQVRTGTGVLSVADGEVSILTFIPGFGNIVILSHGDGYRTVYAHLSEINVVESQKVKAGDVIAKSGDSVELKGSILHFEVWKGTVKQDPEHWLAKQR
jgi:septal ring factor EnvC (AmiA/AmiB activator)